MTRPHPRTRFAFAIALSTAALALSLCGHPALSAPLPVPAAHAWTPTWAASPEPLWGPSFVLPTNIPEAFERQTLRQLARVSLGGPRVRIELSNEYGTQPLHVAAAHVARSQDGPAIEAGTDRTLRFGGASSVVIAPGASVVSDPADLAVPDAGSVTISLYFAQTARTAGYHWDAQQTAWVVDGDATAARTFAHDARRLSTRAFLTGVLVERPAPAPVVVCVGDSLTDGNGSTPDANRRWPDALADRLQGRGIAVLNAGISGGRLLRDGMGESALARMTRDVLAPAGARAVVVMLGINDIGWPGSPFAPAEPAASSADLIAGLRQFAARTHAHGLRVVGATITPFEDALKGTPLEGHYSPAKDAVRREVNAWIRNTGEFDAVADFDALLRDPADPARLAAPFDSGDHLHPSDAGYRAMAAAIDIDALLK